MHKNIKKILNSNGKHINVKLNCKLTKCELRIQTSQLFNSFKIYLLQNRESGNSLYSDYTNYDYNGWGNSWVVYEDSYSNANLHRAKSSFSNNGVSFNELLSKLKLKKKLHNYE